MKEFYLKLPIPLYTFFENPSEEILAVLNRGMQNKRCSLKVFLQLFKINKNCPAKFAEAVFSISFWMKSVGGPSNCTGYVFLC